jgi:hypothetical protein
MCPNISSSTSLEGSFHKQNFTSIVNRRCTQFLRGEWHHLFETAIEQNDQQNEIQEQQSPQKRKKTSDAKNIYSPADS